MHELLVDLRYGVRMLRQAPVTALIAVASLGFAIAVNTTTFSLASGFLLGTFRWGAPEELVFVMENSRSDPEGAEAAPGNLLDWKESSTALAGLEAYTVKPRNLTGGDRPERLDVVEATPGLLDLLGRQPVRGRSFTADDAGPSGARVAVVTHRFFEHRFSGGRGGLGMGSSISIDGVPHTIVGVMPDDFDFLPADVEVFTPVDLAPRRHDRSDRTYLAVGRIAPGARIEEVRAELDAVAARLEREFPETNRGYGVEVQTLRELFPGRTDERLLYVFLAVAALVLVIAGANLVNLFLARADARRNELAVRRALGAGRARVGRVLLVESLLVGALGGLFGIVGSFFSVRAIEGIMPAQLPAVFRPELDTAVVAYGVVVSLLGGALLGVLPALQASRVEPAVALGEVSRGGSGSRRRRRLRAGFIVAETGLSLALLIAAGILSETFSTVLRANGKLEVDGLLTLGLTADEHRFAGDAEVAAFYREVTRRLGELPGARTSTTLSSLPRSMDNPRAQITIDGRPAPGATEAPWTGWQSVGPDYFSTLGVPMVEGRGILASDRAGGAAVAVVNESFARLFFPNQAAIGRRVTIEGASREIVGVCADFAQLRIKDAGVLETAVFLPFEQHPVRTASLAVRVDGDPMALADAARAAVWAVDPDQPVVAVQTLRSHIESSLGGPLVLSKALAMMGTVALLLSAIGMYGLIAHDVGQRRREIGIRMALGAAPRTVVRSVVARGLGIAGLGMILGGPLAWAMARAIETAFAGLATVHASSIALLVALLTAVALIASWLPAVNAARTRPARVLQGD